MLSNKTNKIEECPHALSGLKVLDLSRFAPGPFCTGILGDLGADIIKIEEAGKPSGRRAENGKGRAMPEVREFAPPDSPYDPSNRNKRSIGINLKSDAGREIFYRLVKRTDIVVEGFRPGVTERLGIGYEKLREINKRIIYCAITGYGQGGPYKFLPGHDVNYISHAGYLSILNEPRLPGNLIGDIAGGGMQAVIGILAAVIAREKTGEGQFVDISITDGVISQLGPYFAAYSMNKKMPDKTDMVSTGTAPFYNLYRTKDNKMLSLGCSEPWFYVNLCKAIGCEDMIPYQGEVEKYKEVTERFTRRFLTKTRDEWFDILTKSDIAISKVLLFDELADDPQVRHREMIVELDHPEIGKVRQAGIPVKLSATPGGIRKFAPKRGEDAAEILMEIGYSKEEIKRLEEEEIIYAGEKQSAERRGQSA
ncbi:MAG: CoA transferase [Deltaproteobacteria bacterium]|nr:CoA transferase [Deltaproteobacteria bacterium]